MIRRSTFTRCTGFSAKESRSVRGSWTEWQTTYYFSQRPKMPNKYARIVEALDKCSVRLTELQKDRYETLRHASIRDTVPNIRCEEAKDVESLREIASAEKLGNSAYEENVPHRNDLPPREVLPYRTPGPTLGD